MVPKTGANLTQPLFDHQRDYCNRAVSPLFPYALFLTVMCAGAGMAGFISHTPEFGLKAMRV